MCYITYYGTYYIGVIKIWKIGNSNNVSYIIYCVLNYDRLYNGKYNMKCQSLQNFNSNVLKIHNVLCRYELYITIPELYVPI